MEESDFLLLTALIWKSCNIAPTHLAPHSGVLIPLAINDFRRDTIKKRVTRTIMPSTTIDNDIAHGTTYNYTRSLSIFELRGESRHTHHKHICVHSSNIWQGIYRHREVCLFISVSRTWWMQAKSSTCSKNEAAENAQLWTNINHHYIREGPVKLPTYKTGDAYIKIACTTQRPSGIWSADPVWCPINNVFATLMTTHDPTAMNHVGRRRTSRESQAVRRINKRDTGPTV